MKLRRFWGSTYGTSRLDIAQGRYARLLTRAHCSAREAVSGGSARAVPAVDLLSSCEVLAHWLGMAARTGVGPAARSHRRAAFGFRRAASSQGGADAVVGADGGA